ncbi:putative exocyst complex [Clavispora lusitaniae]|uniref:Exocyst complex protein EXO70 n=3 Tax=Clavispora lusitaniae TaxID=36911 RepID=C4Y3V1_CLAL4|nr:uncharacterized protein CLUG_02323 [Clavispora lusitaniae ATCC 42720]KAF5211540.1 exocyst complex component exo70 [Clavispora lusitaniae]EEQ38197.1 hypothetical protein CLUG_02323 [Clavispora lusitaniae ATCC 42720]KAF7580398.1 Exo70 exocyst complex subunit family protein [Clavispora lusitaniae]OVF05529.1 putative exocyst complex protein [Clavispora lusitaniae]QFZ27965.1 putative exocyst complex [Clavispora lusitaniae]
MLKVDVDEADVAVLTQNLARSKQVFEDLSRSLRTIGQKTQSGSQSIRPVLAKFNSLTAKKQSVEEGLALLKDVSRYSAEAAESQRILTGPVEATGIQKYLACLESSAQLLHDMKRDIRDFEGVVIGFANAVDKAEMSVVKYFSQVMNGVDLTTGVIPKKQDALAVLAYFTQQGNLRNAHAAVEKALYTQLCKLMAASEPACTFPKRQSNIPYEKGSSGIEKYTEKLLLYAKSVSTVCEELRVSGSPILSNTLCGYLDNRLTPILIRYNTSLDQSGPLTYDIATLELLDSLVHMDAALTKYKCSFAACASVTKEYGKLRNKASSLLIEWVKYVDARVSQVERFNEFSIPEVIVDVISKIRRICEFNSLQLLIEGKKLGSWLDIKPPLRFISVYTSVIPGAEASAEDLNKFLASSYISDLIDELMVNIEINLKEQTGDNSLRKSSQGFLLIKNLVMIETIINRSESFYQQLGQIGLERLQRLKNRFLKLFLDDWNYASYIIIRDMTQITTTNAMNGGQHSTKEREQTKELFKNFNESFEEALKQYEKFNIQEKDLKVYLSGEIKKLIINAYNKLYDKYGNGEFTKNRAKYIKYDKSQFERLLNERL